MLAAVRNRRIKRIYVLNEQKTSNIVRKLYPKETSNLSTLGFSSGNEGADRRSPVLQFTKYVHTFFLIVLHVILQGRDFTHKEID